MPAPRRSDSLRIRAQLLAHARTMVQTEGPPIALNELARRAEVGVGTVYRHFANSQSLLEAVAAQEVGELLDVVREAVTDTDAWNGLARIARAHVALEVQRAGVREVLAASTTSDPSVAALKAEMVQLVDGLLDRARAAGQLRPGLSAVDLTRILCGVGYAASLDPARAAETAEVHLGALLRGLRQG
jgi:AcrR family transcriptional regulator